MCVEPLSKASGWLVKMTTKMGLILCHDRRCWTITACCFQKPPKFSIFSMVLTRTVFLLDEDSDLIIIQSQQGSRQGCTAGTEAFCLEIHPVMHALQVRYPEFVFRLLTDDLVPLLPPPASDSFDDWQALYIRNATV